MNYAYLFRQFRERNNLTLKEASELLAVHQRALQFYEAGERNPGPAIRKRLAELMHLPEQALENGAAWDKSAVQDNLSVEDLLLRFKGMLYTNHYTAEDIDRIIVLVNEACIKAKWKTSGNKDSHG